MPETSESALPLLREAEVLNAAYGRPDAVRFVASPLGGVVAELKFEGASATVALFGGQVLQWIPAGHAPALWLSPQARLNAGKAVRGGIPLCWPWFGPSPEAGRPAHGFLRTRNWTVRSTEQGPHGVSLTLGCAILPGDPPAFHAAAVSLRVSLGRSLSVALATRNRGVAPMTISEALHTYLAVGGIEAVRVTGLEGSPFLDQLSGKTQEEAAPLTIDREIDRIYAHLNKPVEVIDPGAGRRITIEKSGSASTVVWNPWLEKSARLGDMGTDGYRRMLCIETANAGLGARTIEPGSAHTLTAILSAAHL